MKTAAALLMLANTALFIFGAVQHAGLSIGPFHEPLIIPAAIVESVCGACLLFGAIALLRDSKKHDSKKHDSKKQWTIALAANFIALAGVLLGIVALAVGAGPRTASNDWYHRIMLVLIAAAVLILLLARRRSKSAGTEV